MPKRVKKTIRKPRKDVNQGAVDLVALTTRDREDDFQVQLKAYMSELGRRGGTISGERRMTNLTGEQRRDIASKAARAMWAKRRRKA